jgi:hypothetical protein
VSIGAVAACSLVTSYEGLLAPAAGAADATTSAPDAGAMDGGSALDAVGPVPGDGGDASADSGDGEAAPTVDPCAGMPDGTSLDAGDPFARCCGGVTVETTSNANCGVCGVVCDTMRGQSCSALEAEYFCVGCAANADCWSGCCDPHAVAHCAPVSCTNGGCQLPEVCPGGSHCTPTAPTGALKYCSY